MIRTPIFLLYGLLTLGGFGYLSTRGLSPGITEVKDVPKSVRENPGVYRSHYSYLPRWFPGK